MREVSLALWLCGLVLASFAGCASPESAADTTVGEDAGTDDAAVGALDGGETAGDGDAAEDSAPKADSAPGDSADVGGDSKTGKDAAVAAKGCQKQDDCLGLAVTVCQLAACVTATGLCEVVALPDDATCPGIGDDKCKVNPRCTAGKCKYTLASCDDENPCTDDSCAPASGCGHDKSAAKLCTDGSPCTVSAKCVNGSCNVAQSLACDDKEPCTDDACDPKLGCIHSKADNTKPCDDAVFCTDNDACASGKCSGKAKVCQNDDNSCTITECESKANQGCTTLFLPNIVCDDKKPCTKDDLCDVSGACSGKPDSCDDKNPCTDDSCDADTGCANKNNTKPCAGKDACSGAGVCKDGACALPVITCDDGNLCTADSCDPVLGCVGKPSPAPCFDGSVCSENDSCQAGACKAGSALNCDDSKPCTADACDPKTGCSHAAALFGADCGGGKKCAVGLCLAEDCGDGWCAPSESALLCAKDCPEEGGACKATDGTCLAGCKGTKCTAADSNCKATAGCPEVGVCLQACADDVACQVACLLMAGGPASQGFVEFDSCMQAFCIQDFWLGAKCTGAGLQYSSCVEGCESAMCKLLTLQCKASTGCSAVRTCLQACNQVAPDKLIGCITDCKAKGSTAEVQLNANLDTCSGKYCQ